MATTKSRKAHRPVSAVKELNARIEKIGKSLGADAAWIKGVQNFGDAMLAQGAESLETLESQIAAQFTNRDAYVNVDGTPCSPEQDEQPVSQATAGDETDNEISALEAMLAGYEDEDDVDSDEVEEF